MARILSTTCIGQAQTYDIEVEHSDHQFYLSNGVLTSNSHAVAYGINSYMCAYLLKHYEPEWLCAYMEYMIGDPDKRAKALSEIKSFGYKIGKVDINHSALKWTIGNNKNFIPSFLSVKSVGEAAVQEILENRPYKNAEELLWDNNGEWKHSKFNKRSLEHLIKIRAFDSMDIVGEGKLFDNYKQMYEVMIVNNNDLKKKKGGKQKFYELISQTKGMDDWTNLEKVSMQQELIGDIDVDLLISPEMQEKLENKNIKSIDSLEGKNGIVWFIIAKITYKQTRNKKDYLMFNVIGASGKLIQLNCWNARRDEQLELNRPYIAKVEKNNFGVSCRINDLKRIG